MSKLGKEKVSYWPPWALINTRAGDSRNSQYSSTDTAVREICLVWELWVADGAQSYNLPVKAKDFPDQLPHSSCDKDCRKVQWDQKVLSWHSTDAPGCFYPFAKQPK